MINKFDDDGTGLIEFTEFLCLMATKVKSVLWLLIMWTFGLNMGAMTPKSFAFVHLTENFNFKNKLV